MKNFKKISITFFILMVWVISCKEDFLEVSPTASITETQLTSKNGLEGMLISGYSMLSGRGQDFYAGSTNWFWGSVLGGEGNKGSNSGDQAQVNEIQSYDPQPTNTSILFKYQTTYEGIARINALLRVLPNAEPTVSEEDKTRIEGEAKFLRGHYYFELKKLFNNTPYIDETVDYSKGIDEVGNDADLWPMIEADFKFAYENLPETQDQEGRANKWAAGAYLAKAYLYQGKFADAKTVFDDVIANGQTAKGEKYGLVENYGDLWRIASDNNKETVFAIQSAAGTGTVNNANPDFALNYPYNGGPAGCCGFFPPSFDLANSFRTSGGLPLLNGSYNNGANQLVNDQGIASDEPFTPDAGPVDPRLDHTVGRRGLPYLDHGIHPGYAWIRDQNYAGPYAPKKNIWSKAEEATGVDKSSWTPGYTALNFPIIRFADVLLMAAEAEIEAGDPMQAREYVNMVRTRAKNSPVYTYKDPDDPSKGFSTTPAANYQISLYTDTWVKDDAARNKVRFERKLELAQEGHRFFDLVRWGIAEQTLNAYLNFERTKVSASPFIGAVFNGGKDEHMPIPQREIDILGSDVLKQNPGY